MIHRDYGRNFNIRKHIFVQSALDCVFRGSRQGKPRYSKTNVHMLKVSNAFCSSIKCNCSYKSNSAGFCKPADVWNECGSVDLVHCPKQSNFSLLPVMAFTVFSDPSGFFQLPWAQSYIKAFIWLSQPKLALDFHLASLDVCIMMAYCISGAGEKFRTVQEIVSECCLVCLHFVSCFITMIPFYFSRFSRM